MQIFLNARIQVRKQYVHLSAYVCEMCAGLVIAGAVAVRENEISKETEIRSVGPPICLSCGHRQAGATEPARVRHLLPIPWEPVGKVDDRLPTAAYVEEMSHAELR